MENYKQAQIQDILNIPCCREHLECFLLEKRLKVFLVSLLVLSY